MASGTEMLLVTLLKSFMPKEAADKILEMVESGVFDRLGEVPFKIAEIENGIADLNRKFDALSNRSNVRDGQFDGGRTDNPLPATAIGGGPNQPPFAEYRGGDFTRPADIAGASGPVDAERGGPFTPLIRNGD